MFTVIIRVLREAVFCQLVQQRVHFSVSAYKMEF